MVTLMAISLWVFFSAWAFKAKIEERNPKKAGFQCLLWNSVPVHTNESAGRSGIHVLAHLEATSSLIYVCVYPFHSSPCECLPLPRSSRQVIGAAR